MRLRSLAPRAAALPLAPLALPAQSRALRAEDVYRLQDVRDPQRSPDGRWVAYAVSSADSAKDKNDSDVWMVSWDGRDRVRVTSTPDGESSPRWSPDGKYLAFLSGRQQSEGGEGAQVWLLDRRGGEAQRLTMVKGGVSAFAWSPDARRLALVVEEETDSVARKDTAERKTPKPIVVDRYHFKQDQTGFLGSKRSHLAVFDVATRTLETLTNELFDDEHPSWSPDGQRIAFVRAAPAEPGRPHDTNVWVMDARAGATPRRLTDFLGPDDGPLAWSPDGRTIAFTRGDEPKYYAYSVDKLALVPADGSAPARVVTAALDRPVSNVRWAPDGRALLATISDDREEQLVRIDAATGATERLVSGPRTVRAFSVAGAGATARTAMLYSTPQRAPEVWAMELPARGKRGDPRAEPRVLTHHNDSLMAVLDLATVEPFASRSDDGAEAHALLFRPPGAAKGARLPLVLHVHGGPNAQDAYDFDFIRQVIAASGYAVLAVNYRGSSGRGGEWNRAIFADWGNKEVKDLVGAVDEAVRQGIADPDRLAIGGWSYGGILTDYTIATTPRFKAAVSGAGSAMQIAMYGTDQYVMQYDLELGQPWKSPELWMKLSYPFFHADRIRTPTLFTGGQLDFNVPIIGSEQMYQALRSLGVETQLVVYPNQYHGLTIPSYRIDRLQRHVAWLDRFLKLPTTAGSATP